MNIAISRKVVFPKVVPQDLEILWLSWNYPSKTPATITRQSITRCYKAWVRNQDSRYSQKIRFSHSKTQRNNKLCIIMYQVHNNIVPNYLIDLFTKTSVIHIYETRHAESNSALPKPKTNDRKNHSRTEEQ